MPNATRSRQLLKLERRNVDREYEKWRGSDGEEESGAECKRKAENEPGSRPGLLLHFGRTWTQSVPGSAQTCETGIPMNYISQIALLSSQRSEPAMPRMLATAPELLCSSLAELHHPTTPCPSKPRVRFKGSRSNCAYQRQSLRARGRRFAAC